MKSRWFLALVAVLGLALFSSLSIPVAAATPTVKLVLGGTGATPWAIGNIAPGNSGTNTVTLSNTGYRGGVVTIWLSDINNTEGANPESETGNKAGPGELGDYLMLNISGTKLSTDFNLPAKVYDFPQSAADTKHIYVNPLEAFSTLNLQWDWQLPPETGNDVQGDGLSFTINYALEEFPPLPSSPSPPSGGGSGGGGSPTIDQDGTTVFKPEQPAPSSPLPPALVPTQTAPADFEVRNLAVYPVQAKPEESISISFEVINTGGQRGEFTLTIDITGRMQTSQKIILEAGQTQVISLTLPPGSPGIYQVDIGGEKDTFTIEALPPVMSIPPAPPGIQKVMNDWLIPAILAVIGAAALVYYIVFVMMRRRTRWDWIPYIFTSAAVNVLAQTAEQQTLYITRHQKRVAQLASAIAREMNLSKKLVKMLLTVGIIQDRSSVELSYPVAQTALQYHERLNGSGHPLKLAGDDILLEARILAVADTVETLADTVETMSSLKPNPAISLDKILEEVKRNSGTLYDSEVVKAFVRLVDRADFGFQTRYH